MPDALSLLDDGRRAEKLGLLDRALDSYRLAASASEDPDVIAEALSREADVLRLRCDWALATATARRAQEVAERAGLPIRHAEALNAEASVGLARGDLDAARTLFERMVDATSDPRLRGIGLQNLGTVHAQQGDLDRAEAAFAESSECFRACSYDRGLAIALNNMGRVALDRAEHVRAAAVLERAVNAAAAVEDEELIALAMTNLGEATLAASDFHRAHDLVCAALGHFRTSGNRWREVECLRLLGTINERRARIDDARVCYERGLQLAQSIDARLEVIGLSARLTAIGSAAELRV